MSVAVCVHACACVYVCTCVLVCMCVCVCVCYECGGCGLSLGLPPSLMAPHTTTPATTMRSCCSGVASYPALPHMSRVGLDTLRGGSSTWRASPGHLWMSLPDFCCPLVWGPPCRAEEAASSELFLKPGDQRGNPGPDDAEAVLKRVWGRRLAG